MRTCMVVSFFLCLTNVVWGATGNQVLQFDVSGVLNSDVVVNRVRAHVDTSQQPIDSPAFGQTNFSFLTQTAAAVALGGNGNGLPDDAFFPANQDHPEVQLHWRNYDYGNNARRLSRPGQFIVDVPNLNYESLHLFAVSGQGSSDFRVHFRYEDGVFVSNRRQVPDWFDDPVATSERYFLANGMDRSKANASFVQNVNDTGLFGFSFPLDSSRVLNSFVVDVTRVPNGVIAGIPYEGAFSFFGATGVAVPEPSTSLMVFLVGILFSRVRIPTTRASRTCMFR